MMAAKSRPAIRAAAYERERLHSRPPGKYRKIACPANERAPDRATGRVAAELVNALAEGDLLRAWLIAIVGLTAAAPGVATVPKRHPAAVRASSATPAALAAAARSILGAKQGVYVEAADGTVLVAQNAATPVHPASVSKVPTTLAMLRRLGPDHRFVTTFATNGRNVDGTLHGDLLVESDGNPSLVDEDALLVAERLKESGIRRIAGEVRLQGNLTFNWQPASDGTPLRLALSGKTRPAAWLAIQQMAGQDLPSGDSLATPGIQFAPGDDAGGPTDAPASRPLVVHRSQPLLSLLKGLNDYSNNIFAQFVSDIGGVQVVETLARGVMPPEMGSEITLGDAAGADPGNRLSPRAAVKLLRALEQELAGSGRTLVDVLPVAGIDEGTLHDRLNSPAEAGRVVGKTGTFDNYGASALIGAISTPDRGPIYFAILDHGVKAVRARPRQDRFVRTLLSRLHGMPWRYLPDTRPAFARAEVVASAH
jgi:D-alanyl-D-alanine carboxypeptidase/D-alanyl-D-alanine-endopeptidase (penicillin-binding protein 4)